MKKITAEEFEIFVKRDPAWASKLSEPVEITNYCPLSHSPITHLSPLLHFTGLNVLEESASFHYCHALKIAEGNFRGAVSFVGSNIEMIGELCIAHTDSDGRSASFMQCRNLKTAQGTFPGHVTFSDSGVEKIVNLNIRRPSSGFVASFEGCKALKVAEGTFSGSVLFNCSGVRTIGNLNVEKADESGDAALFYRCRRLKVAKGNFAGYVDFSCSGIERIGDLFVTGTKKGKKLGIEGCGNLRMVPANFKASEIEWGEDWEHTIAPKAHKNVKRIIEDLKRRGIVRQLRNEPSMEI